MLVGELGSGKTQFVKGLAKGLGIKENITSPTFTYEKIYKGLPAGKAGKKLTLYHFDLYREEKIDSDIELLVEEAFADKSGVVVIEWAERAKKIWPLYYFKVQFSWVGENERTIEISNRR